MKSRNYPPFDGLSLTPVGIDSLEQPIRRPERVHTIHPDGSIVIDKVEADGRTVRQTCRLTPEGATAISEAPIEDEGYSHDELDVSEIARPDLWGGEWVGRDGSAYRVSDGGVSILVDSGAIELSWRDLAAVLEGAPILDLCRTRDGWRLMVGRIDSDEVLCHLSGGRRHRHWRAIVGRIDSDEPSRFWLCSLLISANGKELLPENAPSKVALREAVRCWCALGAGRMAVGYASGRIEILSLNEERARVLAVGFTLTPPEDLAVSRGPSGTYLVVVAEDVFWFNLDALHPSG